MASQGPNYAAACTNDSYYLGDPWSNPTNAQANDGVYATCSLDSGDNSNDLKWTNFGFSIPAGAAIDGVAAQVTFKTSLGGSIGDYACRLVIGGVVQSTNRTSNNGMPSGTSPFTAGYGSSTDLWGATLTSSTVNATNFGLSWTCNDDAGVACVCSVDYATLTVYYTASSPQTITINPIADGSAPGTASLILGKVLSLSSIPDGSSVGSPSLLLGKVLSLSSIGDSSAVGSPTLARVPVYRVSITVPAGKVTETLTDFLLSVRIPIPTGHYTGRLYFQDTSGNPLPSVLVSSTSTSLDAIVKTTLSTSSSTIYAYYH